LIPVWEGVYKIILNVNCALSIELDALGD